MKKTKLKTIKKLLLRDIKYGFYENRYKYLVFILMILVLSIISAASYRGTIRGNFADIIMNILPGERNVEIHIPILWILINSYVLFIIGSYAYDDYKENSLYIIYRTNGKMEFWISKFLWTILNVLLCYIILFGIIMAVGYIILGGGFSYSAYSELTTLPSMLRVATIGELVFTISTSFLALWLSLSLLQLSLSIIMKPINAYIFIMVFLMIGIFIPSPIFPAQYCMILRNEIFDNLYNITLLKTVIYNCIIAMVAILIGIFAINKKELL